jgi:hypothetical protein
MRVVEVLIVQADYSKMLIDMDEWFYRHNRPRARFETEEDGDTITVKVQFEADGLAEAFRQDFSGSYGN